MLFLITFRHNKSYHISFPSKPYTKQNIAMNTVFS